MTVGINHSVLEFFPTLDRQHHRKWFADGRTWPVSNGLNRLPPFQFYIKDAVTNGVNVGDIDLRNLATGAITPLYGFGGVNELPGLSVVTVGVDRTIIYDGINQFTSLNMAPGEYYITMQYGANTVTSEVFGMETVVTNYLKLSWWHNENFLHEGGAYVYPIPFKFFYYINTEMARPKMIYEDEVQNRNGYLFKMKQTRVKELTFNFLATEGILDVVSLIGHHHNITVDYRGDTYEIVDFKATEDWSVSKGDLCKIEVVMRSGVVVTSIGSPTVQAEYSDAYGDAYTN
jgi:hypothetical protein